MLLQDVPLPFTHSIAPSANPPLLPPIEQVALAMLCDIK
jgi:hypothetical protein